MNADPSSLDNLRDIAVPPPVPWWPPAVGWWFVFAALAVVTAVALFLAWRRWRANAYRRAALRELASATSIAEIAEILKRTALAAYSRTDVAALSGPAWCAWLGQTARQDVPDRIADALTCGIYDNQDGVIIGDVSTFAANWISHHECPTKGRKELNSC